MYIDTDKYISTYAKDTSVYIDNDFYSYLDLYLYIYGYVNSYTW